jgi:hypothetical protein
VLEAPDWHRCEISDSWSKAASTAGGCFNFETWRSNPQWQLRIGSVSHAHFVLLQVREADTFDGPARALHGLRPRVRVRSRVCARACARVCAHVCACACPPFRRG